MIGKGGLTVSDLVHEAHRLPKIMRAATHAPDVIFVQIGGNDFRRGTSPSDLALDILALASLLKGRFKASFVMFGQILPRFKTEGPLKWWSLDAKEAREYNRWAQQVNVLVEDMLQDIPYTKLWHHSGKLGSKVHTRHLFVDDGVHLSEQGMFRFYRSVRGALIFGAHKKAKASC
jgi:lysophospholipase L1-like esterase